MNKAQPQTAWLHLLPCMSRDSANAIISLETRAIADAEKVIARANELAEELASKHWTEAEIAAAKTKFAKMRGVSE